MEVPFEQIGPGQVGRVAFQVIGKDGPVWNPQNLRFMPVDQAPPQVSQASDSELGTALSGINLLASAGILVISQQILREVNHISQKLERIDAKLDTMDGKLDQLLAKAEAIDAKVSENNLRHGLDHVLRASLTPDQISVEGIVAARRDMETFVLSIPGFGLGGSLGLRLSSDVVHKMESIWRFLFNLRCMILSKHNQSVGGDPRRTVAFDFVEDYLSHAGTPEQVASIAGAYEAAGAGLDALKETVSFSDEDDLKAMEGVFNEKVWAPILTSMGDMGVNIWLLLSDAELPDEKEMARIVTEFRRSWLWHTDAGLVFRTCCEIGWAEEGYNASLCEGRLSDSPLRETRKLDVLCEMPKPSKE